MPAIAKGKVVRPEAPMILVQTLCIAALKFGRWLVIYVTRNIHGIGAVSCACHANSSEMCVGRLPVTVDLLLFTLVPS